MPGAKVPAFWRHILLRIRLYSSLLIGLLAYLSFPPLLERATRGLTAWNLAIVVYLVMVGFMMARSTHESMRRRSKQLDEGRHVVLALATAAALSSLAAVVVELFNLRNATGGVVAIHVGLSVVTIITSWSFVHLIFAEHYAHSFYLLDDDPEEGANSADSQQGRGLRFPGQPRPDYLDFLYFSFTIGVANQTADTEVVSRGMRALVLIHSVISYFFNTIILALTINIAASMLGG